MKKIISIGLVLTLILANVFIAYADDSEATPKYHLDILKNK